MIFLFSQQLKDSAVITSALYSLMVNKDITMDDAFKSYPLTSYVDEDQNVKSEVMNRYFLMYGKEQEDRTKESIM